MILTSCNNEKNTTEVKKGTPQEYKELFSFQPTKQLKIEIDEFSPYRTFNSQLINEDSNDPILIWENEPLNALEFYSLNDQKLVKRMKIKRRGPNGINGPIRGFEYLAKDSILVSNGRRYEFYLIDEKGLPYEKYEVYPEGSERVSSIPIVYDNKPIMYSFPYVYIASKPDNDYNSEGWWDGNLLLKINLQNKKFEYLLNGPEKYFDKIHGAFFSHNSTVMNEDKEIVISYPIDSDVAIFNPKNQNVEWKYGGSKHFHEIPDWNKPASGQSEKFYIESDSYREIIYDKWRDVYYRFAYRKVDYTDKNGAKVNWNYKFPSIIILDKELKKIGEYDLPKDTYYTRNTFVGEKGLYISINHEENLEADENYLSFQLLEPIVDI
ncbi:MAG: DUF4221 family protein [Bacteroidota bacterium]